MLVCAFSVRNCTRDRGCSVHPVFPAPSDFEEGKRRCKPRADYVARMRNYIQPSLRANGSRECAPDDRLRDIRDHSHTAPDIAALIRVTRFSYRKTRPATTRRGGIRIDHTERRADQIVDEIDLRACEERHRG